MNQRPTRLCSLCKALPWLLVLLGAPAGVWAEPATMLVLPPVVDDAETSPIPSLANLLSAWAGQVPELAVIPASALGEDPSLPVEACQGAIACLASLGRDAKAALVLEARFSGGGVDSLLRLRVIDAAAEQVLASGEGFLAGRGPAVVRIAQGVANTLLTEDLWGTLELDVDLPEGRLVVNGRLVGTTPLDPVRLPVGERELRLLVPDYQLWRERVQLRAGRVVRLRPQLVALGAPAADTGEPSLEPLDLLADDEPPLLDLPEIDDLPPLDLPMPDETDLAVADDTEPALPADDLPGEAPGQLAEPAGEPEAPGLVPSQGPPEEEDAARLGGLTVGAGVAAALGTAGVVLAAVLGSSARSLAIQAVDEPIQLTAFELHQQATGRATQANLSLGVAGVGLTTAAVLVLIDLLD